MRWSCVNIVYIAVGFINRVLLFPSTHKTFTLLTFSFLYTEGDVTEADRQKELTDKRKKAAFRSSVIGELRQQYSEAPDEIRERQEFHTERDIREEQHRWGLSYCGVNVVSC